MRTVLTIAGYDPSSGAGVTADLIVFAAHGLFGISAITALTVQSTLGVRASYPVDAGILRETLDCLDEDARSVGIKVGMVGSSANIPIISDYIRTVNPADVITVLDPILISSSGRKLLESKGIETLHELLPLVDWVTPNVDELGALIDKTVESRQGLAAAAHELQRQVGEGRRGQRIGVLAKGGHLDIPDDLVLTPDGEEHWLTGERIETSATHGTGCALSSAFLSRLVLGDAPIAAARKAKDYVANAMRRAPGIGRGKGPMDLLWPLRGEQYR